MEPFWQCWTPAGSDRVDCIRQPCITPPPTRLQDRCASSFYVSACSFGVGLGVGGPNRRNDEKLNGQRFIITRWCGAGANRRNAAHRSDGNAADLGQSIGVLEIGAKLAYDIEKGGGFEVEYRRFIRKSRHNFRKPKFRLVQGPNDLPALAKTVLAAETGWLTQVGYVTNVQGTSRPPYESVLRRICPTPALCVNEGDTRAP